MSIVLKVCTSSSDLKSYIDFTKEVYKSHSSYRDTMGPILKEILFKKSSFANSIEGIPVLAIKDSKICAACIFIYVERLRDTLQLSFFEALPNCKDAVDSLIAKGRELCRQYGVTKLLIGLNGHVNYGLGLLCDKFDCITSFGANYNPSYYIDYFKSYNPLEHTLVSYLTDLKSFNLVREEKIINRISTGFTFRTAKLSQLKKEIDIYTKINNLCFKDHPFYYERKLSEDYELFKDLSLFIKGENLLFAEKDGQAIGFMLWYPDFNELIKEGESIGVKTFLKNKLHGKNIRTMKIVEIGIIPEYQGTGAILGLFKKCAELTVGRYDTCESSWIMDANIKSKGFGIRWAQEEYKHYKVFEIAL